MQTQYGCLDPAKFGFRLGGLNQHIQQLFDLSKRTIIITGGMGSMGLNIASAVMQSGGDVVLIDRIPISNPSLSSPIATLTALANAQPHGTRWQYYQCDIRDAAAVHTTFGYAYLHARHGYPIRGLVACAGISHGSTAALDYDISDFKRVLDVNVTGTFICAREAAGIMCVQRNPGSIVLMASMSGTVSNKGVDTSAYNASKAALLQLARSLAAEWSSARPSPPIPPALQSSTSAPKPPKPQLSPQLSPQIRVNTISPGYTYTAHTAAGMTIPGREEQWSNENMLGRMGHADEYRGPAVFLLSDASSFTTGSEVRVDGGHCAW